MDLKFIYGKAYSDLKTECITEIKLDIEDSNIHRVLVITDDTFKNEINIGIRSEGIIDPDLKIQITTIKELCSSTINTFGDRRIKPINEDEEFALLAYSIEKVKEQLKLYGDTALNDTFIQSIKNTISTLKKECISIDILQEKSVNINNKLTQDKLDDLILIYKEYNKNINGLYLDSNDKIQYASKLLQKQRNYGNTSIYIYKLEEISQQELTLIKEVSSNNCKITVLVNNDSFNRTPSNLSGAFFKTDALVSKLMKLSNENCNINKKYLTNKSSSEELNHLDENLFSYPYAELKEELNDIFLTECSSIDDEVEVLVSNIEELKSQGFDLENITVAVSNINQYERSILRSLNKHNIPHSISSTRKLSFHPLSRLIDTVIDLYSDRNTDTFLRILKTGYTIFNLEDVCILEKYIKRTSIKDFKEINIDELAILKFEQIEELTALINTLITMFDKYEEKNTFDDYYKYMYDFLDSSNILNIIHTNIRDELENNSNSITLNTWKSIIRQLDSYSRVLGTKEISIEVFLFLITQIVSTLEETSNTLMKGVNITTHNKIEDNPEIVFILGANEGVLPTKPKTNTIFSDRDIKELNEVGFLQGEDIISITLSEQFNTYKLLTRPLKKLFVSFPVIGKDLAVMKKSSITERLKQLFPTITSSRTLKNIKEHNVLINTDSNLQCFNFIKDTLFKISSLDSIEKESAINKIEELNQIDLYSSYIDNSVKALKYKNEAKCDDKYTLQSLYYSDTLSVSKLEKYAKCPFAYFSEYGLKVKEDEPTTLQAKHIGIALHSIFEQFDKRIKTNNIKWDEVDSNYIAKEVDLIFNYLDKRESLEIFNSSETSKYYKNKLKELAKTSLFAITNHIGNSFFTCAGHEINFDDRGTYPPITIKLPSGKRIKLRGQIDRLDEMKTNDGKFIRIIDYKTGNTSLDFTEIYHGTQLQLLTYLDAIIEGSKEDNLIPAGVFYFKADDPYTKAMPYISDNSIMENKLKELRMKGLFTDNESTIQCMDKGIYDGEYKTSLNIQARFKTDGSLSKSTPGISLEDLKILSEYTKETIKEFAYKILVEGDISISPTKKKSIDACKYCSYKSICQFDETLDFNNFRQLNELSKEEVINLASKKVSVYNE